MQIVTRRCVKFLIIQFLHIVCFLNRTTHTSRLMGTTRELSPLASFLRVKATKSASKIKDQAARSSRKRKDVYLTKLALIVSVVFANRTSFVLESLSFISVSKKLAWQKQNLNCFAKNKTD